MRRIFTLAIRQNCSRIGELTFRQAMSGQTSPACCPIKLPSKIPISGQHLAQRAERPVAYGAGSAASFFFTIVR
ncbi:hypothetical protein RRSWK_00220 [Rhodopirellula sp. SWK7]|nr:hypothetical protein RRSWK_00220 [Rhodopirellula sp. SWK7]